ncbi:hypothetical protein KAR91_15890 [Candidatus Pacearchaeota archaeon]|nr:hypothetical protein [Candidatus Pacearchaeota archaeon]
MNFSLLYKEKSFLNHQFPTIKATKDPPTAYEGMIRCEKGEVKKLAQKKIWPFTDYIDWHRFRLDLPKEYPLKPPIVTWLTDISHPNIVTDIPGAVCNSVLGEEWKPNLKLVSVVNALYYLLSDPNPNNVFDDPKCLKAAEICRKNGFPKWRVQKKTEESKASRFNILPVPRPSEKGGSGEITKFIILGKREE